MMERAGAGFTTGLALWAVGALLGAGSGCRHATPPPDDGPRSPAALIADPPVVADASLQLLAGSPGTARLQVRYGASPSSLPARIPLDLDGGPAWLFDDGAHGDGAARDALYAGDVPIDLAALGAYQAQIDRAEQAAHGGVTVVQFDGRVVSGTKPVAKLDLAALQSGKPAALSANWVLPSAIDAQRSLLISDPAVIADAARTFNGCNGVGGGAGTGLGKWTFGYLMQQAAGSQDPSTFVRQWLAHWESGQTVNGFTAKQRSLIKKDVIDPWQQASGGPDHPLDLAKAPFRLLAIVNRVDFAEGVVYGAGRGGELRFVFGAVRQPAKGASSSACGALRFTVIFEYDIGQTKCTALRQYARQWVDLAALTPGSPAYNSALAAITDPITQANAAPAQPNGSALNQIRTNEIALPDLASTDQDKAFWDMREFHIATTGGLTQTTVAQAPDLSRNRTAALADYVNANAATIVLDHHVVPPQFPAGVSFLGANALMQPFTPGPASSGGDPGTFWTAPAAAPIALPDARFHFSLNTCNGCHAGETGTNAMHISPLATPAPLSGFLTGITFADPVQTGTTHTFGDLERRRTELARIANLPCLLQIFRRPVPMVD